MMHLPSEQTTKLAQELRSTMGGRVYTASEPEYESLRRVWNGAVDHHPALIALCEENSDVVATVDFARISGLEVSVLSGGYDWVGRSIRDRGIVIDLSSMRKVSIDQQVRIATVEGGATSLEVDSAAAEFGLCAVTGALGKIGMVGFTLAGGYGPLTPRFGLGLDNLMSAQCVLPSGKVVQANKDENVDLFWALRGGGGNFAIVTSMEIRLHPLTEVLAGKVLFPSNEAASVLTSYATLMRTASDSLAVTASIVTVPNAGRAVGLAPHWSGGTAEGRKVIEKLLTFGSPLHAEVKTMEPKEYFALFDSSVPQGRHYEKRTRWLAELAPDSIAKLIEVGEIASSPMSLIGLQSFHGAPTRIATGETAFGLRKRHYLVNIIAGWEPNNDDAGLDHRQWAQRASTALEPFSLAGGYTNLLGPAEQAQIDSAYGANRPRVLAAKNAFDPDSMLNATPLPNS
jgi:FAD/FMN-containing dehydrogenase